MAKKPVKLVFRSKPIIIILVMVLLVGGTVGVVAMHTALDASRAQYESLRQPAAALEADNAELSENIDSLGSIESVIRIAGEILGLIDPDSVIFAPEND